MNHPVTTTPSRQRRLVKAIPDFIDSFADDWQDLGPISPAAPLEAITDLTLTMNPLCNAVNRLFDHCKRH